MIASPVSPEVSLHRAKGPKPFVVKLLSPEWIKAIREEAGLTQERFAEKLGGRINKGMVSKWENDVDPPHGKNARRLLEFYELRHSPEDRSRGSRVELPIMNPIERLILAKLHSLSLERQGALLEELTLEVDRLGQSPPALKKG